MSYKTILVHAGPGAGAEKRIRLAARLARDAGAHLVGSAPTGISRFMPPASFTAGGAAFVARCEELRREAADALARFEHIAREEGLDSFEARLIDDEVGASMALQARYADLVVAGQDDPGVLAPVPHDLPEYLVLAGGRPVLVIPAAEGLHDFRQDALVAWDGSVEATRAVSGALPLLRAARRTTVLGFGDDLAHSGASLAECERLAAWLRRHGIAAQAASHAPGDDPGEALLSAAADAGAGLLVMGGYGHARFRELLLGGVTATILRAMTLPVLFAH